MIRINLFAACSQDSDAIKTKKEIIKKQCQKLNEGYAEKIRFEDLSKKDVSSDLENDNVEYYSEENVPSITPVTYDDPERREKVHKSYIKNKADILIFLIGDKIDATLEKDLKLAVEHSKKSRGPELLVYFKNDKLWDELKSILGKDGRMYRLPEEDKDFEKNVEWMLRDHIRKYNNKRILQKWIRVWKLIAMAVLIFAISIFIFYLDSKQKRLLIVGGGSATNYIETTFNINKHHHTFYSWLFTPEKYWLFVPMPSGDSYRTIAEERINCHNGSTDRYYYPIVVSAEESPKDDVFLKSYSVSDFKKEGIVISMCIGFDTLVVYGNDSLIKSDRIYASALDSLIQYSTNNKDTTCIYRTSITSGTFKAYNNDTVCPALKNRNDLKFFSDIDSISVKKWIALGSASYYPIYNTDSTFHSIVISEDEHAFLKPIYIYFMLYRQKKSYVLPNATKIFLQKLDVDNEAIIDVINEIDTAGTIIIKGAMVKTRFDGLNNTYTNDTIVINDTITINNSTILYELPYIKQQRK